MTFEEAICKTHPTVPSNFAGSKVVAARSFSLPNIDRSLNQTGTPSLMFGKKKESCHNCTVDLFVICSLTFVVLLTMVSHLTVLKIPVFKNMCCRLAWVCTHVCAFSASLCLCFWLIYLLFIRKWSHGVSEVEYLHFWVKLHSMNLQRTNGIKCIFNYYG